MSYRGYAVTVAALTVPLAVTLTWRSSAPPPRPKVTSSLASVPTEARAWLGAPNGPTRPIDFGAYCRDLLDTPEPVSPPLTPAANLDRVTRDVAARLAFRKDLRLRGTPLEDVRLGLGMPSDYPVPEILLRAVPFEGLVAYVPASYTRVYALAEPLDAAVDRFRARVEAVAPRVMCGLYPERLPRTSELAEVRVEGHERVVIIHVPANSCEPGSYFEVRIFRRGEVTYLVHGGPEAYENERFVDVGRLVTEALAR